MSGPSPAGDGRVWIYGIFQTRIVAIRDKVKDREENDGNGAANEYYWREQGKGYGLVTL